MKQCLSSPSLPRSPEERKKLKKEGEEKGE